MKRFTMIAVLCAAIIVPGSTAWSAERYHTKLLPHSLVYPLISPMPYRSRTGDPYGNSFAVRRVFRSVVGKDYDSALLESLKHHENYGSYGVLGRGEDVFTGRAARYRARRQGD